ncbi:MULTISPECIES: alpha-L-arabinofuranosidase C-terminal domain-containing protein [unclassified Paenibacillus]|uniref:alpha-L-arabinofuranosidase C-terminal domain-containing protein n=1 Tax=unclassified Paenibacillus TaxID=185978 RepID=UPI0024051145|nr:MULTISPECIES: alpha-L-arabinofuranosidase C-terminal domain-containing protein [unclassified Paenibacillus]MDF9841659.1 alpha-L-arabinofuranosidase [Paenibacillus sp. PastF-2]MDF9848229.1 alpha-L-arabinofuranosidase [Paenibacillus sp. PastM-2]MDF9854818.1 alpha-L-arabinofuranosidase [Paenibacillus sp. PastF-1]MDH6480088.1 alpha-L-arabinofuranosidase [Paenibacillus sp. PastH-2]MDH6507521.1 alpha-L-arabinofuranosidase [Paenibacillus sp. PastM-3]
MDKQTKLKVYAQQTGAPLGDLFGIFFEDLNHAADGGLYAELVQNRSFEFDPIDHPSYHALTAWEKAERGDGRAELSIASESPFHPKNPHYAVIEITEPGDGVGLSNAGFNTGIPVKEGEHYLFSLYARRSDSFSTPVRVLIEDSNGAACASAELTVESDQWQKYEAVLTAGCTDNACRLVILTGGQGRLEVDLVSLFPQKTYLGRRNGLREDIAVLLADMKPKFMRFPGGCLVHDGSLNPHDRNSMYRWKNTIGELAERPARRNNWQYNQTLGLGYYEYFQFCEDIGAKAIPVLPGGYDPHHKRIVPLGELGPWIQDALDLIEFATGDATTEWGGIRSSLGHPEPFGLEYIAIGNEEVGEPFFERYPYFHKAIKERYPHIQVINSSGPFAAGGEYERGWASAREHGSDLVDEHYYQSPEWFLANMDRYDSFKADEPKVFLGEYASWGNTYYNALVEAAFMTRLERGAHAVGLACYAPMLCNVDYVNWKPDMIWFNNHEVFGTPNYYVQKLFMNHQGDRLLGIAAENLPEKPEPVQEPVKGSIVLAAEKSAVTYSNITLTNNHTGEQKVIEAPVELNDTEGTVSKEEEQRSFLLGETDWSDYTLRLTARKTGGVCAFLIFFGMQDSKNRLNWELGGWQNQDSTLSAVVNGRGSCLTQSLFTVEKDTDYELELHVSGRVITASINGAVINSAEDRVPDIQPLYYTASVEEATGDVIVKAVNVLGTPLPVTVELQELAAASYQAEVHELSGVELDAENSFAEPLKVSPSSRTIAFEGSSFDYEFPAHSVTVFRVQKA